MLVNDIYSFITSSKLIESVFILFISIFLLVFIIRNIIVIAGIILLVSIILFTLNYIPLWLFTLMLIMIGGEMYNKVIKKGDLNE